MPTYEYSCDSCQGHFEYFQTMTEAAKTQCEKCGGRLSRLVGSGAGLVFKGSGFYITDYKAANAGSGAPAADGGASSSAGTSTASASAESSSASPASSTTPSAPATTTPASSSSATSGS